MIKANFVVVVVTEKDMQTVENNVKEKNLNVYYEGIILENSKIVYCYISPRVSILITALWYSYYCSMVLLLLLLFVCSKYKSKSTS